MNNLFKKAGMLTAFLLTVGFAQAFDLKVWMSSPKMVADGTTVTYLTVYQTDAEELYSDMNMQINVPEGIHIAQKKSGRNYVNDITANVDRFDGTEIGIACNMPDATSIRVITTNATKNTWYRDDADGNIVEELFTIGLIADNEMVNGDYEITLSSVKFVKLDATANVPSETVKATMSVTGGQNGDGGNLTYTLSEAGYGTLILPFEANLPEGVKAYTCTALDGQMVVMEEQSVVPACTPVILAGTPGSYNFTGNGEATEDSYTTGLLTGVFKATEIEDGYVLQQQSGTTGFYCVDANDPKTVPANRCYLNVPASVKMLRLDMADGIETIMTNADEKVFDLSGRRATRNSRGVVVKNGRKVINK